jgi:hypothetical protein
MGVITNANILRIKRFYYKLRRRAYRHIRTRRLHHPRTNSLYTLLQRNTPRRQNTSGNRRCSRQPRFRLINIVK